MLKTLKIMLPSCLVAVICSHRIEADMIHMLNEPLITLASKRPT